MGWSKVGLLTCLFVFSADEDLTGREEGLKNPSGAAGTRKRNSSKSSALPPRRLLDEQMRAMVTRVLERNGIFANTDEELREHLLESFYVIEPVR